MVFTQKRIKEIMSVKDMGERESALRTLANELGCSLSSTYTPDAKHLEEEVIRRIQEAARSIRESRLWLIALTSAFASVLSALAAWFAVWKALY
jgi:hypothetical protein